MGFIAFSLNLPWTLVGFILALISLPRNIQINAKPFTFVISVRSFWWQTWLPHHTAVRASSIGNVVLLGGDLLPNDLEHELVHVAQYERRPFIQAFLYVHESLRHGYRKNKYEIEAYEKVGNKYVE